MKIVVSLLAMTLLGGCAAAGLATGVAMVAAPGVVASNNKASTITEKYTEAQIQRCANSLSTSEQLRIREKAQQRAYIPIVGPSLINKTFYEEAEKICKKKGLL